MLRMLSPSTGSESLRPRHAAPPAKATPTAAGVTSICYCVNIARAYTSAGPLSPKQNGVFTSVSHWVTPIRTLCTQPTLVGEQAAVHFVDPRATACTCCGAETRACLIRAVDLRPRGPFPSILSGAMASSVVSSVLYLRGAAGIMPRRVYLLRRRSKFPRMGIPC